MYFNLSTFISVDTFSFQVLSCLFSGIARAFPLVDNGLLTRVMFTPCGRGMTHAFVDKNLLTRVMFTPCGGGVTHAFVDKKSLH